MYIKPTFYNLALINKIWFTAYLMRGETFKTDNHLTESKLGWKAKGLILNLLKEYESEQIQLPSREWNKHHQAAKNVQTCSTVARSAFPVFLVFPIAVSLMLSLIAVVTEFDIPTFILPSHSWVVQNSRHQIISKKGTTPRWIKHDRCFVRSDKYIHMVRHQCYIKINTATDIKTWA